jgi:hypothetical protein
MPALASRRGVKRCNAGEHRELGLALKAPHARHLSHELRRRQRPATWQFEQGRATAKYWVSPPPLRGQPEGSTPLGSGDADSDR